MENLTYRRDKQIPTIVLSVSSDTDIENERWIVYELSFVACRIMFLDAETGECVEVQYWTENSGFQHFFPEELIQTVTAVFLDNSWWNLLPL